LTNKKCSDNFRINTNYALTGNRAWVSVDTEGSMGQSEPIINRQNIKNTAIVSQAVECYASKKVKGNKRFVTADT
jgi:hypothetical protein